jgi:cytochrome c553
MSAMAKPLTEKEIRDLAGYYANQQGLTSSKPSIVGTQTVVFPATTLPGTPLVNK